MKFIGWFGFFSLLCKVIFQFPDNICFLPVGKENAAFWGDNTCLGDADVTYSSWCYPLPCRCLQLFCWAAETSSQKKKLLQQRKKGFFLVFLPHCLHRAISKSIAFCQHNYTGWGCGCILNFLLIFFSSFYRFLAHLKYGSSQGKCEMPGFLVCRKELICLWVWGWGICKSLDMDYFLSFPVCEI